MNIKFFFLSAAIAVFFSCNEEQAEGPVIPQTDELIPVNISMGLDVKVSDTSFDNGDDVAVYMVNYSDGQPGTLLTSGNHYDAWKYTFGSGWSAAEPMYWLDHTTKAEFYCFHPYAVPYDINAYRFRTSADQSTLGAYKASDFVWGKTEGIAPTRETVQLNTNHILSNIVIMLEPGDGFTTESLAAAGLKVKVNDVLTEAVIDIAGGSVSATGTTSDVIPYKDGGCYRAVIVPQTVADGSDLIVVIDGEDEYILKKGFTFRQGMKHRFTLKVNRLSNGINVGVGDWGEGENVSGEI